MKAIHTTHEQTSQPSVQVEPSASTDPLKWQLLMHSQDSTAFSRKSSSNICLTEREKVKMYTELGQKTNKHQEHENTKSKQHLTTSASQSQDITFSSNCNILSCNWRKADSSSFNRILVGGYDVSGFDIRECPVFGLAFICKPRADPGVRRHKEKQKGKCHSQFKARDKKEWTS